MEEMESVRGELEKERGENRREVEREKDEKKELEKERDNLLQQIDNLINKQQPQQQQRQQQHWGSAEEERSNGRSIVSPSAPTVHFAPDAQIQSNPGMFHIKYLLLQSCLGLQEHLCHLSSVTTIANEYNSITSYTSIDFLF